MSEATSEALVPLERSGQVVAFQAPPPRKIGRNGIGIKLVRRILAFAIFVLFAGRVLWHRNQRHNLAVKSLVRYDLDKNSRLAITEVASWLLDNGIKVSSDQLTELASHYDLDNDGFSILEMLQVADQFDDFPNASSALKEMGESVVEDILAYDSGPYSDAVCLSFGLVLLIVLVWDTEGMENAQHVLQREHKQLQKNCGGLQRKIRTLSADEANLQQRIQKMSEDGKATSAEAMGLKEELEQIQQEKNSRVGQYMTAMREMVTRVLPNRGTGQTDFAKDGFSNATVKFREWRGNDLPGMEVQHYVFGRFDEEEGMMHMYEFQSLLGIGKDSAYLCSEVLTGVQYCCKVFPIKAQKFGATDAKDVARELRAMMQLQEKTRKCPLIMQYHDVVETASQVFVVMELIPGDDLFNIVLGTTPPGEKEMLQIFKQVSEGIQHMHVHGIVHGDIKAENVMVSNYEPGKGGDVKVIDFGYSASQGDEEASQCNDHLSAPEHSCRPKERIKQMLNCEDRHFLPSKEGDVFRLGVMLYITMMKNFPFQASGPGFCGVKDRRVTGEYAPFSPGLSTELTDLLAKMLTPQPQSRPTIDEVLEHNWLKTTVSA